MLCTILELYLLHLAHMKQSMDENGWVKGNGGQWRDRTNVTVGRQKKHWGDAEWKSIGM